MRMFSGYIIHEKYFNYYVNVHASNSGRNPTLY